VTGEMPERMTISLLRAANISFASFSLKAAFSLVA